MLPGGRGQCLRAGGQSWVLDLWLAGPYLGVCPEAGVALQSLDSLPADGGWPPCPVSCLAHEVPALLPGCCWVVPGLRAKEPRYLHPVAGLMQLSVPQGICYQCSRSQSEPQPCTPPHFPHLCLCQPQI